MTMLKTARVAAVAILLVPAAGLEAADRVNDARASPSTALHAPAPGEIRLSKLIGMKVHNAEGENLGHIKDLVVDANSGRVHYAVLSFGGVLGLGDKLFGVPVSRLHRDPKGKLVLDVAREQLKSAPAFASDHWPDWNDKSVRAEMDRRYGASPGELDARFRRASDMLRTKVRDSHGGDIGRVDDMVVDLRDGRLEYVVVDFDRAWNPNDKRVALPMSAFADGATAGRAQPPAEAGAPPRNTSPALALTNPSNEPSKGTASAVNPPSSVPTRPAPIDPTARSGVQPLPEPPLKTTTSYADDEGLVFKGSREQVRDAPAFDAKRYRD